MKRIVIILLTMLCITVLDAQELRMTVQINSSKIQGTNKQVFETLQGAITEFMNGHKWSNLTVAPQEQIECTMSIIVNSVTDNMFNCEMTLQSKRPVYQTNYDTPLLNMRDKAFCFSYAEFDKLEYSDGVFTTNLADMLAYYAYLILGYDADSYSSLGGTPFFQQCENIVSMAQGSSIAKEEMAGWKAFDSRTNRYAIANNLMDEAFKKYREYFYAYHRLGLDIMSANVENGRARIAKDISVLRDANRARPAAGVITLFLDAKNDELVNIFKGGTTDEKTSVNKVLVDIDPTRSDAYDQITK